MPKSKPKESKPRKGPPVRFYESDRKLIRDHTRRRFADIFSETFPLVSFQASEFVYPDGWFHHRPCRIGVRIKGTTPSQRENLDRTLKSYGFDENFRGIVKWALSIPAPKLERDIERTAFHNWFEYLYSGIRLGAIRKEWEGARIPEDAAIKITGELMKEVFGRTFTLDKKGMFTSIEQRFQRWIKDRWSLKFTVHAERGKKKKMKMETLRGRASMKE